MTSRRLLRDGLQSLERSASVGGFPLQSRQAPPELKARPVTGSYWYELKVSEELVTDRYVGSTVFTVVAVLFRDVEISARTRRDGTGFMRRDGLYPIDARPKTYSGEIGQLFGTLHYLIRLAETKSNQCVGIMILTSKALSYIVLLYILMVLAECSVNNGGQMKKIQSRETNVFNFLRLLLMRLVYGVATAMGFSDGISEFMGGAFVPPGVDDDYGDYADYDF